MEDWKADLVYRFYDGAFDRAFNGGSCGDDGYETVWDEIDMIADGDPVFREDLRIAVFNGDHDGFHAREDY